MGNGNDTNTASLTKFRGLVQNIKKAYSYFKPNI